MSRGAIGLNGWLHWLFWRQSLTYESQVGLELRILWPWPPGCGDETPCLAPLLFLFFKRRNLVRRALIWDCNFNMALHESFLSITGLMKHRCPLGSEETLLAENAHLCLSEMLRSPFPNTWSCTTATPSLVPDSTRPRHTSDHTHPLGTGLSGGIFGLWVNMSLSCARASLQSCDREGKQQTFNRPVLLRHVSRGLGVFHALPTHHIFKLLRAYQDTPLQQAKRSICIVSKGSMRGCVSVWGVCRGCVRVSVCVWGVGVYMCEHMCVGGGGRIQVHEEKEEVCLFPWQVDSLALILLFWDKVSHSPGWLQSHCLTMTGLQIMILCLPPKSWNRSVRHTVPIATSHGRNNPQQASQWLYTSVAKQAVTHSSKWPYRLTEGRFSFSWQVFYYMSKSYEGLRGRGQLLMPAVLGSKHRKAAVLSQAHSWEAAREPSGASHTLIIAKWRTIHGTDLKASGMAVSYIHETRAPTNILSVGEPDCVHISVKNVSDLAEVT